MLNHYPKTYLHGHRYKYSRAIAATSNYGLISFESIRPSFATLFLLLAGLFIGILGYGQGSCPTSNCTSGDMTITNVELVQTDGSPLPNTCIPGQQTVAVKLRVTFNATSKTRYGFLIIGDLTINGSSAGKIYQCYAEDFTQGDHTRILDQIIQWPCGSTLSLTHVYTAWDNQAPSTTICSYLNADGSISNCGAKA
jgi:hypothetical protein